METIWEALSQSRTKQWFLTSFFPALLFMSALVWLYVDIQNSWTDFWNHWYSLQDDLKLGILLFCILTVTVVAIILDAISADILRWVAGYTSGFWVFDKLSRWRREKHRKVVANLTKKFSDLSDKIAKGEADVAAVLDYQYIDEKLHYYPVDATKTMPTTVGNILRSGEDYVQKRYGLDLVVTWIRLYPSLSEPLRDALENTQLSLNLGVRLMFLTLVFIILAIPLEWLRFGWERGVISFVLGFFAFLIFRRWAIHFAKIYSELVRSAFDLHRFELYESLHLPCPSTSGAEEQIFGTQLSQFLWRGSITPIIYNYPTTRHRKTLSEEKQ